MKAKNKLLLLAMYVAVLIGFASIDSLAATSNGTGGGNWNNPATWVGNTLPTSGEDVTIAADDVVVVNLDLTDANGNRSVGTLTVNGTLRPDAGVRNIEVDNDLVIGAAGQVNYNYLTTGRLNWTFTGVTDGASLINNNQTTLAPANRITALQFHNVAFAGAGVNLTASNKGFVVYGDMTVSALSSVNVSGADSVMFSNTAAKSITNNNILQFSTIHLVGGSAINYNGVSGSSNIIGGNITIGTSSTFTAIAPSVIDLTGGSTVFYNSGNFNFNSGTELNISHAFDMTISTSDINNFNGALTFGATTITLESRSINGTGSLTTNASSIISLANATGVKGALNLTGTRTFTAGNSFIFTDASDTGFDYTTGNDVTSVGDLTITGATTSADSFTITGEFSGAAAFTASAGTITVSGGATTFSGAAKTLNNLTVTSVGTVDLTQSITVTGSFVKTGAGTFEFNTHDVTMTGTGTLSLTNTLAFTGGAGTTGIVIDGASANVTLGANLDMATLGRLTLTAGTLDLASFTVTTAAAATNTRFVFTAGTIRTSAATGLIGNFTGYAASHLNTSAAMNYEFYGAGAGKNLGFLFADVVAGTGGAATGILQINDLTITSGDYTGAGKIFSVAGDITVASGASMITGVVVTMNGTTLQTITNNAATSAALTFTGLTIGSGTTTAANVTTASNFTMAGALTMTGTDADVLTATAGTITFATGADLEFTAAGGVLTLYNVTVSDTQTWANGQSTPGDFRVDGNFSVTAGTLTVTAAQDITFRGYGKTISNAGAAADLDFGIVTIDGTYTTVDDMTFGGSTFDLGTDGSFIAASPSSIVFDNTSLQLTNAADNGSAVDSLVFYDVTFALTGTTNDVIFTVLNDFTTTGVFDGSGANGSIKFMGEPSLLTVTAGTTFEDVIIPSSKTAQYVSGTSILDGTITLNGTLQVNTAAQISGTGNIAFGNGSNIIVDGDVANGVVGAITASGGTTFGAGTNYVNVTFTTNFSTETDLGLGLGTLATHINNLTLNHTSAVATLAGPVTMYGNFSKANNVGTVLLTDVPGNVLTLAGTNKTFTNLDTDVDLALTFDDVTVTGSYTETASSLGFGVGLAAGSDAIFTVSTGTWSSALATNATYVSNSTNTTAIAGAGSKVFNNFTVGDAANSSTTGVDYTVNGNFVVNATAVNYDHASGTVTLAGSSNSLTNNGATRDVLTFNNLTVSGSYSTAVGVNGFEMGASGILTVSGSLSVQSGLTTAPGTTEGLSFFNAGKITGSGTITLGALINTASDLEILTGTTVTIDGDVAGALTLTAGNIFGRGTSTVVLANGGGTNNIVNGGTLIRFANLEVAANAVVTNNVDFTVNRDITVGSGASFVSSAGTITLDSAGTSTITNNGTLTFFNLTVANTADNNITTASDYNVANTMLLGAANVTFTATAGTVTFNGGAQALTDNSTNLNALTFYNLTKSGTGALTYTNGAANNIAIKGDITATGTSGTMNFQAINGDERMFLNGTQEQNIVIGTTAVNAIDFGFLTINNAFGVKLVGATTEGDIQVYRTLRMQNGDLDLNGNNIIEIIETNGLLSETSGNTIINTGTAASVGYVFVSKTPGAAFANNNMNGIGVNMTTAIDPGTMKVRRYSIPRNVGSVDGISRVFGITNTTPTTGLDAKAVFRYDDSELNGLTAADLKMTRTDDQITGPWYLETSTVNTTNRIITVDDIDGFTTGSEYEYWTATAPVTVTTAELTKGLVDNPLVAGRTEQAIYGLEFSANGDVDVNEITFGLDRDVTIANEFSKYYLVKSGDNDYATEDDNEVLISGTNGVPATLTVATAGVTFDVSALDEMVTAGTKLNYFLVVDVATNVTTATSAIGATFNETNLDITNGIAEAVSENGTDYTFKPGLMIDQISNGLTQSPLIAGTTNNGLIGFQITSTSNATDGFDTLFVGTNVDVTDIFSAVRLVRSTTNDVTTGTLTTVKTGTISADGIAFNNLNEASTTTAKFYFLVGDVKSGVDRNTSSVVLTIADEDLNDDANAGPRYINAIGNVSSSFSSPSYSFAKSEVTVSETTPLVAQSTNLGRGVNNQPVFRFTLASDNSNPVSFTKVVAHATLAKGLTAANVTAWRLWYDANGNDYPDTGEQISTGVYNASATQGNLTFDNFTAAQTTSSSRKYIVTVNLAVGTTVNSELSLSLLSQSYVTVTSPAKVNPFTEIEGDTYTVKAPGTASTAKIVGLSTNSVISGGNVSFTVRVFDASDVPANLTSSASVALNVAGGGFTFGGTTTGTILAGGNFVSITPTMSHATGTTTATVTATLSGGLALTTAATQNITVFKSAPTTNGTVTISTVTTTTMQLSGWTAGTGGSGRIVVISATTPPTAPTNGVTYTANTNIGSGGATAQTGPGSFVVAMGASAVTTISGLTPGVTYYVQVFEYDGSGSTIIYNTSSKTSVAVDNAGTITGNPAFKATTAGSIGGASLAAAVNISTDVDVTASITSETEAENGKWFKFKVNSNRNNFYIKISDLPANYSLYLYDNTTGNELLFRTSEALSTTNDAVIVNNATAGEYLIKVFGADNEQYDASTFGLRVVTSASEVMSLEE